MTDHDFLALARRLVASTHWRWLPGMLAAIDGGARVVSVNDNGHIWAWNPYECGEVVSYNNCAMPDLRDAATLGCLLQLVREAWGDPNLSVCEDWSADSPVWRPHSGRRELVNIRVTSEAEALVAALLAAPE